MLTYGVSPQGSEPPDTNRDLSDADSRASNASEWPYIAFVTGLFLLIVVRALVLS
jgi:hypothetical protein